MLERNRFATRTCTRAATALALTLTAAVAPTFAQQPVAAPAYTYAAPTMPTAPSAVFATTPAVRPTPTYTYAAPSTTPTYTYAAPTTYANPANTVAATAYRYAAPAVNRAATYVNTGGDPYGFTAWLNGVRARYGLRPVSYDPNLAGWASANNAQQAARGMGHFVMGPARRQNAAVGNAATVGQQWMNSPAHRAAMLDPSVTAIGLAGNGSYWTLNLR